MRITETFDELLYECKKNNTEIFEIAQEEECFIQDFSIETFRAIVLKNILAMRECIQNGGCLSWCNIIVLCHFFCN